MSDPLRTSVLKLASELPLGNPTRRALLRAITAEGDKVKVLNQDGKEVWVSKDTLKGPDAKKYKPIEDKGDGDEKPEKKDEGKVSLKSPISEVKAIKEVPEDITQGMSENAKRVFDGQNKWSVQTSDDLEEALGAIQDSIRYNTPKDTSEKDWDDDTRQIIEAQKKWLAVIEKETGIKAKGGDKPKKEEKGKSYPDDTDTDEIESLGDVPDSVMEGLDDDQIEEVEEHLGKIRGKNTLQEVRHALSSALATWKQDEAVTKALKKYQSFVEKENPGLKLKLSADKTAIGEVAKTILDQMGGYGRLKMMIGIQQVVDLRKGVGFKWPNKQRSKGNYVEIILTPRDEYDMTFYNVSTGGKKEVKKFRGIYFDQLIELFEKQTGWYLRL